MNSDIPPDPEIKARNHHLLGFGFVCALTLISGGITGGLAWPVGIFIAGLIGVGVTAPPVPSKPLPNLTPTQRTGRNLRAVGLLLLFVGVVVIVRALISDTTLPVGISNNAPRVHNLGLMHDQTLGLILGGFIALGGLLIVVTAKR